MPHTEADKTRKKEAVTKEKCEKGGVAERHDCTLTTASFSPCFLTEGTEHNLTRLGGEVSGLEMRR